MQKMMQGFKRINHKYRKNNQRKGGIRLVGIKSLECNFNPKENTYNPHFHLVVINKEVAEIIKQEWLMLWKSKWTNERAQYIRPIESLERDLIETIKYGSKIVTDPEKKRKSGTQDNPKIYAAALYNIFDAMKGLRIFDRFGFNLPKEKEKRVSGSRLVNDFHEWIFLPEYYDWHSTENELVLSAYVPTNEILKILENNVDTLLD